METITIEKIKDKVMMLSLLASNQIIPTDPPTRGSTGGSIPRTLEDSTRQINNPILSDVIRAKTGSSVINMLIQNFITLLLIAATVAAFFIIIASGIRFITAGGDKAQTEGATKQITGAIIGLILIFSLWAILLLIGNFLGIDLMKFSIGPLILK